MGDGCDGDIPFRPECFESHSALYLTVDFCICSFLFQEEASLMMAEQVTDLRVKQIIIRESFHCYVPLGEQ